MERFRKAQDAAETVAARCNGAVIQTGSSLREEDFTRWSDIDLLEVTAEKPEDRWEHDRVDNIPVSILRQELFCRSCRKQTGKHVYLAVERGILAGIADTRKEAEALQRSLTLEKLLLWYDDQYSRLQKEEQRYQRTVHFMQQLVTWFRREEESEGATALRFFRNRTSFEDAESWTDAVETFLTERDDSGGNRCGWTPDT